MATCCSPHTLHMAPKTPCTAVCLSTRPSLPGSVRPTMAADRQADALAVTKVFPASRSLPATAASSCAAPWGPR